MVWKDALLALQDAGGSAVASRHGGVGPVDLLWEVAGEQSTKYFHRLGRQNPAAPVGRTSVRVTSPAGVSHVHSVHHDSGGLYAVGQALSAFFDGRQGGLFAPGQVDAQAQQLMLDSITEFMPEKEASACLGPWPGGWHDHPDLPGGGHAGGARWQGAWQ